MSLLNTRSALLMSGVPAAQQGHGEQLRQHKAACVPGSHMFFCIWTSCSHYLPTRAHQIAHLPYLTHPTATAQLYSKQRQVT